jgi:seryl-tRNA synthetase
MSLQSATDPFFATVSAAKKFYQAAHDVKNEVLLPVLGPDGAAKMLAGGSINLHGRFFGERFDIRGPDGGPAHTGCIGLGIERWVLAGFTQHGFDPDRWPAEVRAAVFA